MTAVDSSKSCMELENGIFGDKLEKLLNVDKKTKERLGLEILL
jgi:hypothetical protein